MLPHTCRSSRCPILACPYDVLRVLFAYVDRAALHSLYATCKTLSDVVTPLLYRLITLSDGEDLEERFTFLCIRPDRARFVQSCKISIVHPWDDITCRSTMILLISALWEMPRLKSLIIWSETSLLPQQRQLLLNMAHIDDPPPPWHLESFVSNTDVPPLQLLKRQSISLKHLSLPPSASLFVGCPHSLPALVSLRGQFHFIEKMIYSRPVIRVHLDDVLRTNDVKRFTDALALSSVPVSQVAIKIEELCSGTIVSLAVGTPSIEHLVIFSPCTWIVSGGSIGMMVKGGRSRGNISGLRQFFLALHNFPKLRSLSLLTSFDTLLFGRPRRLVGLLNMPEWAPEGLERVLVQTNIERWKQFAVRKSGSTAGSGNEGGTPNRDREQRSLVQVDHGEIRPEKGFVEDYWC